MLRQRIILWTTYQIGRIFGLFGFQVPHFIGYANLKAAAYLYTDFEY